MKLKETKSRFAIVLYKNYCKYLKNSLVEREYEDLEEAKYDCVVLSRCDKMNYCIYDVTQKKLIF